MRKFKQPFVQITTWIAFGLAFLGYLMIRGAARHFDNYVSYIMLATGIGFILFFAIHRETILYVDPENPAHIYLDLNFIR